MGGTQAKGAEKLRIAVLMGGDSQERDVSRVTGTAVAQALASRGHEVTLVDTSRGVMQLSDAAQLKIGQAPPEVMASPPESPQTLKAASLPEPPQTSIQNVERLAGSLHRVDVVFLALHGGWGEDGTIQGFFEMAGIPYTGSGVLGSALAMDKDRAKVVVREAGVPTPPWAVLDLQGRDEPTADELQRAWAKAGGGDVIVKPNAEGSTVGLSFVKRGGDLEEAVRTASRYGRRILVERFIEGRELTVSIVGQDVLPIVEIIPDGGIYTYQAKYTKGQSRYEAPAKLSADLTARVQRSAFDAFRALGLEGLARVDYRLAPDDSFWFLEANTIPGMTPLSLLPMAAKASGVTFEELVEKLCVLGAARTMRRGNAPGSAGVASAAASGSSTGSGR